ncbi:hypothetical protein [Candidatus Thioglobus sp.]|uniref:hypothetical protein n=1 Tax=Candidatus Thioglobus sp. TaxID=2026721 RepID=UPI003D0A3371
MRLVKDLEKQQVGVRMPTYLLNDIDEITKKYKVNRSEILIEAVKSYVAEIKEQVVYERLGESMQEVKLMMDGKIPTIDARSLIDELKNQEDD